MASYHSEKFKCSFCDNTFENPVLLPCNKSICLRDVRTIQSNNQSIDCPMCSENHSIPENGFPNDTKLELAIYEATNGKQKTTVNFSRLMELYHNFKKLKENPFKIIESQCSEIRESINELRINNKQRIDLYCDQFLEEIQFFENESKSKISQGLNPYPSDNDSNSSDYLSNKINDLKSRSNLAGPINEDKLKIDISKLEKKIQKKSIDLEKSVKLKDTIKFKSKLIEKNDLGTIEIKRTSFKKHTESSESKGEKYYMALKDYKANSSDELSYKKGEVLIVKEPRGIMWSAVKSDKNGLVDPKNFIQSPNEDWYYSNLRREQAEEYLKNPANKPGAFLIRKSTTSEQQYYTLSVLNKNHEVRHYKIYGSLRTDGVWEYYLHTTSTKFSSLKSLVSNHSEKSDGLCTELTHVCHKN